MFNIIHVSRQCFMPELVGPRFSRPSPARVCPGQVRISGFVTVNVSIRKVSFVVMMNN